MLTLIAIFITVAGAGFAFWFYNRKQIQSLSEKIEDKNAVINSFRDHLSPSNGEASTNIPIKFNPESEVVLDIRSEKKKQRYGNRPKKNSSQEKNQKSKQHPQQNTEKKNRPKPRKSKTQQ